MKKLIAVLILALIAFVNASYLTYRSYELDKQIQANWKMEASFCDVSNTLSCSTVLKNPYAKVFWIPFTTIAMAIYPIIFAIAFLWILWLLKNSFLILTILWIWWILFNSYFIYQEFFNIKAFCLLCILCSGIILTIAIISIFWLYDKKIIKN